MTEPTVITSTQLAFDRSAILRRVYKDKTHFVVEKNGLPVAVILPVDDYRDLLKTTEMPTDD